MAAIDLVVLGMLKREPLSAYDIQKLIEYRKISEWDGPKKQSGTEHRPGFAAHLKNHLRPGSGNRQFPKLPLL